MNSQPFLWAAGEQANITKPLADLKNKGWSYGDVPAASNVNWVLNKMTTDIAALRADLQVQSEVFEEKLTDKTDQLKAKITAVSMRQISDHRFAMGMLRQTCDMLYVLVEQIQRHHANFPAITWPMRTHIPNEISNSADS